MIKAILTQAWRRKRSMGNYDFGAIVSFLRRDSATSFIRSAASVSASSRLTYVAIALPFFGSACRPPNLLNFHIQVRVMTGTTTASPLATRPRATSNSVS